MLRLRKNEVLHHFKVVIVGDTGVGKSSLLLRFADNAFTESYISTIGVDFRFRRLDVNGRAVKLQIWDTAGQERFRAITSAYYRGADGVIIVYDTGNRRTLEQSVNWLRDVQAVGRNTTDNHLPVILIGNKIDARVVKKEEGNEFATLHHIDLYQEVSAKSGEGVEEAFRALTALMLGSNPRDAQTVDVRGGASDQTVSTCCT